VAAGLVVAETIRVIETDINARDQIGGETDKPGVAKVVSSPGLAGDRLADCFDGNAGPPLYDALHHRYDLEADPGSAICSRVSGTAGMALVSQ
jgi:hypothetical protein